MKTGIRFKAILTVLSFFGVAVLALVGFTPTTYGAAPLKIACSAQAFEILKGAPLDLAMEKTGLVLEVEVTSSGEAVDRLLYGLCDLAVSADRIDPRLSAAGFLEFPFCKDPLIVVANNRTMIKEMSSAQVRKVFSKKIKNASEIGGRDRSLVVVVPGEKTALYQNFLRMFMDGEKIHYDVMTTQSTFVEEFARRVEGAVTFVNQSTTNPRLGRPLATTLVKIDGFLPEDSDYPYVEVFYLVIKGEPTPDMQKVLDFLLSQEFCQVMPAKCIKDVQP